jgi:hypothetical protein
MGCDDRPLRETGLLGGKELSLEGCVDPVVTGNLSLALDGAWRPKEVIVNR